MEELAGVRDGMLAFYERFSSGDAEAFAAGIADVPGVSVIGSGLDEGPTERGDWISTFAAMMAGEMKGTRLEGNSPRGGRRIARVLRRQASVRVARRKQASDAADRGPARARWRVEGGAPSLLGRGTRRGGSRARRMRST